MLSLYSVRVLLILVCRSHNCIKTYFFWKLIYLNLILSLIWSTLYIYVHLKKNKRGSIFVKSLSDQIIDNYTNSGGLVWEVCLNELWKMIPVSLYSRWIITVLKIMLGQEKICDFKVLLEMFITYIPTCWNTSCVKLFKSSNAKWYWFLL